MSFYYSNIEDFLVTLFIAFVGLNKNFYELYEEINTLPVFLNDI